MGNKETLIFCPGMAFLCSVCSLLFVLFACNVSLFIMPGTRGDNEFPSKMKAIVMRKDQLSETKLAMNSLGFCFS